jgi:hypothetical protein
MTPSNHTTDLKIVDKEQSIKITRIKLNNEMEDLFLIMSACTSTKDFIFN